MVWDGSKFTGILAWILLVHQTKVIKMQEDHCNEQCEKQPSKMQNICKRKKCVRGFPRAPTHRVLSGTGFLGQDQNLGPTFACTLFPFSHVTPSHCSTTRLHWGKQTSSITGNWRFSQFLTQWGKETEVVSQDNCPACAIGYTLRSLLKWVKIWKISAKEANT